MTHAPRPPARVLGVYGPASFEDEHRLMQMIWEVQETGGLDPCWQETARAAAASVAVLVPVLGTAPPPAPVSYPLRAPVQCHRCGKAATGAVNTGALAGGKDQWEATCRECQRGRWKEAEEKAAG